MRGMDTVPTAFLQNREGRHYAHQTRFAAALRARLVFVDGLWNGCYNQVIWLFV
jgi:hypothetical protein